jgi:hypothetical protein
MAVQANGGTGVLGLDSCLVREVRADRNDGAGIDLGHNGVVVDSSTHGNKNTGIEADFASVLVGNTTRGNGGNGLAGLFGGNSIHRNTAVDNRASGIRSSDGGIVTRNVMRGNVERNLFLNATAGYNLNVITTTPAGTTTVVGGIDMLSNLCDNGSCP